MRTEDKANNNQSFTYPYSLELIKYATPHSQFSQCKKDKILPLSEGNERICYLLTEGYLSLYRISDDRLLVNAQAPVVIGLGNYLSQEGSVYLKTMTDCTLGTLSRPRFMEIIEQHNLWKTLANHLMTISDTLFEINRQLMAPSAYEIIRAQLLLMMNETDDYREKKFIAQYIREKTTLSRSGIMKILSELRQGGFIEIENGILKKVARLPAKY